MARKNASLKNVMVTQELTKKYFKWNDDELKTIDIALNGDLQPLFDVILNRINYEDKVWVAYIIKHTEDINEVWDEKMGQKVIVPKINHFHCVIQFKQNAYTLEEIANIIGIEPQYVEKPKSGRYAFDNMLAYLTHQKDPEKFQYDPKNVLNYINSDDEDRIKDWSYQTISSMNQVNWKAGALKKKKKKAKMGADELEMKILIGQITKNQVLLDDDYYYVYSQNTQRLDNAFYVYGQRKAMKAVEQLKNGEFKTRFYFIYGQSGSGKTTLAKQLINKIIDANYEKNKEIWECYSGASQNAFDDYSGEEIVLLDDVRGNAMDATEWLRLLDPYNASPAKARFKNKPAVACRAIIITSSIEPIKFFYYVKNKGEIDEAMDQFIRRIQMMIEIINVDNYNNDGTKKYKIYNSKFGKPKELSFENSDGKKQLMTVNYDLAPVAETQDKNDVLDCISDEILNNVDYEKNDIKKHIETNEFDRKINEYNEYQESFFVDDEDNGLPF